MALKESKILIGLGIDVRDYEKDLTKVERAHKNLIKKLNKDKVSFSDIAKRAQTAVKEVDELSGQFKYFGNKISAATKDSFNHLVDLKKKIKDTTDDIGALQKSASEAITEESRSKWNAAASSAIAELDGLTKQFGEAKEATKSQYKEIQSLLKSTAKFNDQLKKSAKFDLADMSENIGKAATLAFQSPAKGLLDAARALARGGGGAVARGAQAGMAAGADASGPQKMMLMMAKVAGPIAAIATVMGGLFKVIDAITSKSAKLNKTLLEGMPLAGDWAASTGSSLKTYSGVVNSMRKGIVGGTSDFLLMGSNAEEALGAVNAFAKSSSGSMVKTALDFTKMSGSVEKGSKEFAKNAILYGKALGMQSGEVASMMGDWVSELGVAGSNTIDVMGSIVTAARTSNVPISKFLDVFKQATPSLDIFTNRIESLAGQVKMLMKEMAPGQVKKFMDAFGKGFSQASFEDRTKTTLLAGVANVQGILKEDFSLAAAGFAEDITAATGISAEGLKEKIMEGGTGLQDMLTEAKMKGASGALIGKIRELASREKSRKGGALDVATALKGASIGATYDIFEQVRKSMGVQGESGIDEAVLSKLNFPPEVIDSLTNMKSMISGWKREISTKGMTTNKQMNDNLFKMVAETVASKKSGEEQLKYLKGSGESEEQFLDRMSNLAKNDKSFQDEMSKLSNQQLTRAGSVVGTQVETQVTMEDMAREQYNITSSLGDKLDNIFEILMSKIYLALDGITDIINDIFGYFTSNAVQKTQLKALGEITTQFKTDYGKDKELSFQFGKIHDFVESGIKSGMSDKQIAQDFFKSGIVEKTDPATMLKALKNTGITRVSTGGRGSEELEAAVTRAFSTGDFSKIAESLSAGGDIGRKLILIGEGAGLSKEKRASLQQEMGEKTSLKKKQTQPMDQKAIDELGSIITELSDIETRIDDPKLAAAAAGRVATLKEKGAKLASTGAGKFIKTKDEKGQKLLDELVGSSEKTSEKTEEAAKAAVKEERAAANVSNAVDTGIVLDQSGTKKIMKDSTLEAFRTALLEFSVILAKILTDPKNFGAGLAMHGQSAIGAGFGTSSIMGLGADVDPTKFISTLEENKKKAAAAAPSKQLGGTIPNTGLYMMHRGERVVTASESAGGGGGSVVNNNTFVIKSSNPVKVANEVKRVLAEQQRRH